MTQSEITFRNISGKYGRHGKSMVTNRFLSTSWLYQKLLPAKTTLNMVAEDHHQLNLHILSWLAYQVALTHLRPLHKFKGQIPSISIENAREQLMNSILFMNTANGLDRIHGAGAISWITPPTNALMIPHNAHPMSSDDIDSLSQPLANISLITTLDDESLSASRSRPVMILFADIDSVSPTEFERVQNESAENHKQTHAH